MQVLTLLRSKFSNVLSQWIPEPESLHSALDRIVMSREAQLADYQANVAMPLQKKLGKPPLQIAEEIVAQVDLSGICSSVTIAGQGYVNLRLDPKWIGECLDRALADQERLGIAKVLEPKTFVIDYSSPNVAKPMHVGHIRSTVIGDAIDKILRFQGHHVISDNHLGDWGTQFGMIIYGYKHFRDDASFAKGQVAELSRLYRLVQQLISYQSAVANLGRLEAACVAAARKHALTVEKAAASPNDKKLVKEVANVAGQQKEAADELAKAKSTISQLESDPELFALAQKHPNLEQCVLKETSKLHQGDKENLRLWEEFLPFCKAEIHSVYRRLQIQFDYEYGESYYHDLLPMVVEDLLGRSMAVNSDGAICVFLDGYEAPMIVQKQDGAYLYATTDIATAMFREREFEPDAVLYVVDHRQSEHFQKLFAVLKKIGIQHTDLRHVAFGTVLGDDGKPFKTRSGTVVGLESLLDEAVERARQVVCNPERNSDLSDEEKNIVAETVGIGAIKYADLCHNRTSNYVFDMNKMVQLEGNTAAYIQYSYTRTRGILGKAASAGFSSDRIANAKFAIEAPPELVLSLQLLRFEDMLTQSMNDYLPNIVTEYLYDTAKLFSSFYEQCPVLQAETPETALSRLRLTDLTGKTLKKGLELLGIGTVERM